MLIDFDITPAALRGELDRFFDLAKGKIRRLDESWHPIEGAPVYTKRGHYATRGWTEWTQGFQYGCQILLFDATDDEEFLNLGRHNTVRYMAPHITHIGVHDHGFNNISTYGNLRRLALEKRFIESHEGLDFFELALKASGAVQAARWTRIHDGTGFIHSFNGPHSLFSDTIRSCRSLVVAHQLGHSLMGENDRSFSLLERAIEHMRNTARFNLYYGEGRDTYDVPGRVVHESIFNTTDGQYRCPSTQQGYSPFTTWTRGLAWILLGFAEELEALDGLPEEDLSVFGGKGELTSWMLPAARATADFFIEHTASDGIPYWDTGAPGLDRMPGWREEPSHPDNLYEPVDSSAAAISAQGLLRLANVLGEEGGRYRQAGLTTAHTLFTPPYISEDPRHQGLLLHSIYHRPNNWDYIPEGKVIPQGESCMWGDYHYMELAVYLKRLIDEQPYLVFFDRQ